MLWVKSNCCTFVHCWFKLQLNSSFFTTVFRTTNFFVFIVFCLLRSLSATFVNIFSFLTIIFLRCSLDTGSSYLLRNSPSMVYGHVFVMSRIGPLTKSYSKEMREHHTRLVWYAWPTKWRADLLQRLWRKTYSMIYSDLEYSRTYLP